jgi:protein involved in polysaccharide export with SLBB domain
MKSLLNSGCGRLGSLLCLFLLVSLAAAQGFPGIAAPSAGVSSGAPASLAGIESPIVSTTYVLMPGDGVLVTVAGGLAYSYPAMVTYEGKLTISIVTDPAHPEDASSLQIVDAVNISGLTIKVAQDSLSRVFGRYYRDVTVKLTLTSMRQVVVFIIGEVQSPGVYYAFPVERVSQVLNRAGGLTALGSKTSIQLTRNGRLASIVNVEKFENEGDVTTNPFVESGDRILVPIVTGSVTVKGAVYGRGDYRIRTSALTTEKERVSEGVYELNPGDRVLDLIRRAGGITPWADLSTVYISRRDPRHPSSRVRIDIDLTQALFHNDSTANQLLQNDDALVVPPINTLVYVEGEVVKPGSFLHTPNLKYSDYVGMAGGPTPYAHPSVAFVLRAGRHIAARSDPVIEPGDIVMMPRVGLKWWQDYVQILSAIGVPVAASVVSYLLATRSTTP